MIIGAVIAICVILLVLAFLAPRLSSGPQRGVTKSFGTGGRAASKAPGPLGRWLATTSRSLPQGGHAASFTSRRFFPPLRRSCR